MTAATVCTCTHHVGVHLWDKDGDENSTRCNADGCPCTEYMGVGMDTVSPMVHNLTARDDLVEAIRVASFEHPKAGSHTEWAERINTAVDAYEAAVKVEPPVFTFTETSDPYSFLVNGSFTVHDFAGDPEIPERHADGWGVYIVGSDWSLGYETREDAALAGWREICRLADGA